jgi:hypothetical protein
VASFCLDRMGCRCFDGRLSWEVDQQPGSIAPRPPMPTICRSHPPLPRHWTRSVRSAVLHSISLAQLALAYTRGWAANCPNARIRLKAKIDLANQEIALLREQMRINNTRMESIPPHRRPNHQPPERLAILELKAARIWSLEHSLQESTKL